MKSIYLISFCFLVSEVFAQKQLSEKDKAFFLNYELKLQSLQNKLFSTKIDSLKVKYNKEFLAVLDTVLSAELSFYYPFDSLTQIARLTSPDNKFRIINWNIYKGDGAYFYFGFLQSFVSKDGKYEYFKLVDRSAGIKNPETYIGEPDKWFGMLYYGKIIKNEDYYTLLAWDGNDKITQKKFIEILYFKDNGDPVFGKDVFKMPKKNPRRIVFEYSSEITMSLKYNEDKRMIVFDHLAPKDPFMEGQYQFYGPDFSYDAFDYSKGKWKFIPDIDIKNIKNKNDNSKHVENKNEKPIYTPQ